MVDIVASFEDDLVDEAASVTLYFDLAEGRKADLETAARTAIAFAEMVRHIAVQADFTAEIRIELESGTAGSLGLNAIIRWAKGFASRHPILVSIAATTLLNLQGDVRSWTTGKVLDWLNGTDAPIAARALSVEERKALAAEISKLLVNGIAEKERRQIYYEASKDPVITGIGATGIPGKRPAVIVPSEDFARLAGQPIADEVMSKSRVQTTISTVTLVRPRLKAEVASWRFQHGSMPEFSAEMKDRAFLDAMADDRINLPLKVGTEMEVEIEAEEVFEGGVWVVRKRSVTRVISPSTSPPSSLFK
ncbi:hypothetical protein ACWGM0_10725 [Sphingomonas bisphenolicum]